MTAWPGTIFRSARLVCDPLPVPKLVAPAVKLNALPVLSAYTKLPAWSATASPPDDPDGRAAAVFQLPPARSLLDEVVAAKETAGAHASGLDQLTMASLLASGGYDRQIRHARLAYRRRRGRLATAVLRYAPGVEVTGVAAGLHAVLRLPAGQNEADLVAGAAAHGLAIEGLASYHMGGGSRGPALVVGYGRPTEHAFTTALARLGAALAQAAPPRRRSPKQP
jgi:GntR family transcriptional regulator / MocR family aminotransferase